MRKGGIEPTALLQYMRGLCFGPNLLRDGVLVPISVDELAANARHQNVIWTRPTG